jgi:hypothetical protein
MSIDRMLEWLRKTEIPLTTVSKKTNISRKTLYNWINGGEVRKKSYLKVYNIYKQDIELTNTEIQLTKEGNMEAQYIIDLQKEKIERLENEIKNKNNYGPVYDTQADITFNFETKFNWSLKAPGVKVKYLSQDSAYIPTMAKKLGYTESEIINFLQIDELVEYKDHKIHKLRSEKQKKEMLGIMHNFMKAYNAIKVNTTMLVAEIPVLYNHKNGSVFKANVEYRVNWIKGTGSAHIRWCNE